LYDEEEIPYTKAELGRAEIYRYILKRHDNELDADNEELFSTQRRKKGIKRHKRLELHPLCPDKRTLDRYLGQFFHLLSARFYEAGAFFELIPAWLRFLEKLELIDSAQREKTLHDLKGMDSDLVRLWEKTTNDSALKAGAQAWQENAGLEMAGA
jgi:hypothetical protein